METLKPNPYDCSGCQNLKRKAVDRIADRFPIFEYWCDLHTFVVPNNCSDKSMRIKTEVLEEKPS